MELTTLCGTEACLVIYSPDEQPPVVWPSHDEVQRLIEKFYQAPEFEHIKKMMNLETYMQETISMLQDQLEKMKGKTWNLRQGKLEAEQFMLQIHQGKMLDDFNVNELDWLIWYVEIMWTDIRKPAPAQGYVPLPPPSQSPATTDQIGNAKAMVRGEANSSISSGAGLLGPPYGGAGDSSLAPHLRLQGPSFGASSSVVAEEAPLRPPFSEGSSSNVVVDHLRLPRPPSGGSSSASPFMIFEFPNTDIDLPEGDNLGLFGGQDVGPGHYPLGPLGSSYPASEFGRNYFEVFSGESSSSSSGATSGSETEETS
ncbi:agamous-like MADS-box protein AGL92 [Gossypium australe]|uniref:Agamous-like MADS-box protein AGL92 n=1 Tax=Gossypium australe TaxID=47621 RepID=A0A5B6UDT3_9ROSI|nr:agamous-like MADS-box protein AGL92 [Gossypium australe]